MVEGPGWRKVAHLMADRKQKLKGGAEEGDVPFQITPTDRPHLQTESQL